MRVYQEEADVKIYWPAVLTAFVVIIISCLFFAIAANLPLKFQ